MLGHVFGLWLVRSSGSNAGARESQGHKSVFIFKINETHQVLAPSHCSLPLSSYLACSSLSLLLDFWCWSITALCLPLPPLSIAVAAVADSCGTQAAEKPEPPTRKVEATDPSLSPTDPCLPGSSILLPACNGGLQVTYLSTPLWAQRTNLYWNFTLEKNLLEKSTRQI